MQKGGAFLSQGDHSKTLPLAQSPDPSPGKIIVVRANMLASLSLKFLGNLTILIYCSWIMLSNH